MIKRLDLNNADDRLVLDVFKSLFGMRSFEIRGRAFVWRRTHDALVEYYGPPTEFLRGLWADEASSTDDQNPCHPA